MDTNILPGKQNNSLHLESQSFYKTKSATRRCQRLYIKILGQLDIDKD